MTGGAEWSLIIQAAPMLAFALVVIWREERSQKAHAESGQRIMQEWREYMEQAEERNRALIENILKEQNRVIAEHATRLAELTQQMQHLAQMVERCASLKIDRRPRTTKGNNTNG